MVAAAALACTTDYQKGLDDPKYADPNSLSNQTPPGASIDETPTASSSGGAAAGPKCGTPVAPGTCGLTFAKDVIPVLQPGGCGTGVSCHAMGGVPPVIDFANPDATYLNLANYSAQGGKFYVNPCSVDPAESKIVANLDPANPDRGTVMPPTVGLAAAVTVVTNWVKCGSPK